MRTDQGSTGVNHGSTILYTYFGDIPLIIRTPVDSASLKEADKLARYVYAPLLKLFHEKEIWLIVASGVVLTFAKLTRQSHESWSTILLLYGIGVGVLLLRYLYLEFRFRSRAKKLNHDRLGIELTFQGVRFYGLGQRIRFASWDTYLDAKVGERVLLLFFRPSSSRFSRKKYFIVPLRDLRPPERLDLLLQIPERIRGKSVQQAIAAWRLS